MIGPFELNTVVVGDSRELLKRLPDESVDIVVTSPPYNLGSRYANQSGGAIQGKWSRVIQYDDYQDNMVEEDYRRWQRETILELWRVIKSDGAIYYNHRPRIQKGEVWHRFDLIPDDVVLRQVIVWKRPKGHNFNRGYYVPSYEWIFLIAKPGYKLAKGCSGYGDVWEMNPARNDHPAPYPLELPMRAIGSSNQKAGIVLDPFAGSGTTLEAARIQGFDYLGFELTERWATYAQERAQNAPLHSDIDPSLQV